jgi:hypothetical protein
MSLSKQVYGLTALCLIAALACQKRDELAISPDTPELLAKFAPQEITTDIDFLAPNEQRVLAKIIEASKYMDEIYLRQVHAENPQMAEKLKSRTDKEGQAAYDYFKISYGLWDRLDEHEAPFIGEMPKPEGAGFYPPDMTREEFEAFLNANPESEQAFKSEFTVIRRKEGTLAAVPYSEAYKQWLEPAAKLLEQAAGLTENVSLARYLSSRADAFHTNDYFQSDMDWMDLDSPIEVTIGPYEVYEDKLFGYKAAFESFVTVVDPEESQKLALYKNLLPAMELNLPIPGEMKNLTRGTESPIRVVDAVFTAGDTKSDIQTIAFNLPNNEKVRELKGSKKVLLKNVMTAKYKAILKPIAEKLLAAEQLEYVTAGAFTNDVLFHELSHGLGPGKIVVDGRETEVRLELKELYTAVEEGKADIMGLYNIFFMADKGVLTEEFARQVAVTYLAGIFRHVRFGIAEAHARGACFQFNYLLEKGGFRYDADTGKFAVDFVEFEPAVESLVRDVCMLQARGDYEGTKALLDKYVVIGPDLQAALDKLTDIPVDIVPSYPLADELMGTN